MFFEEPKVEVINLELSDIVTVSNGPGVEDCEGGQTEESPWWDEGD